MQLEELKQVFDQAFRGVFTNNAVFQLPDTMPMQASWASQLGHHVGEHCGGHLGRDAQGRSMRIPVANYRNGRNGPFFKEIS
ncbi:hypothetical protein D3C87_2040150 [compost metagenome]